MTFRFNPPVILMALAAAALASGGCSKNPGGNEADAHAGHDHAPVSDPARTSASCAAHGDPAELCFRCDADLRDPHRLWCNEHKRYEDRCWLCHPELQDTSRAWCDEHSLYEDECSICRTSPRAASTATPAPLTCAEHNVPEAECGICRPEVVQHLAPGQGTKVRMPSSQSARLAGIQTDTPGRDTLGTSIECLAEIAFNQNQLAQVVAPVGGVLESVGVDLGARVKEDQALATLWSATIAEAIAKAVLTHQTLDRERTLRAQRVTSEKDLQEAEATHRAACQQLRTLGFTEEQIDDLSNRPQESVLLEVRAPFDGEVVERNAVKGSLVEPGKALFTLADRAVMWAELSIPESALARVETGQSVLLSLDALPDRTFTGTLTWIGPAVDARTRMARARAEIPNPDGRLRAGMFARARILTSRAETSMVVPTAAVQFVENHPLVFVQLEDDLFEARSVQLGPRQDNQWVVRHGLEGDDQIVVAQAFALKSQLLLSRLGAGCAHE